MRRNVGNADGMLLAYGRVFVLTLLWGVMSMPMLAWVEAQTAQTGQARPSPAGSIQPVPTAHNFTFNIPSKPLPQALTDVSMATGVQILYTSERPFNLTSRPVVGTYSLEQAL